MRHSRNAANRIINKHKTSELRNALPTCPQELLENPLLLFLKKNSKLSTATGMFVVERLALPPLLPDRNFLSLLKTLLCASNDILKLANRFGTFSAHHNSRPRQQGCARVSNSAVGHACSTSLAYHLPTQRVPTSTSAPELGRYW